MSFIILSLNHRNIKEICLLHDPCNTLIKKYHSVKKSFWTKDLPATNRPTTKITTK